MQEETHDFKCPMCLYHARGMLKEYIDSMGTMCPICTYDVKLGTYADPSKPRQLHLESAIHEPTSLGGEENNVRRNDP